MSTIKANTLLAADGTSTTEPSIPALDQRMAKAWCQWNMSSNVIKDSYNISSITDSAAGDQSPVYITPFSNADYAAVANGGAVNDWHGTETTVMATYTTYCRVIHRENNVARDPTTVYLIVFGN